MSTDLSAASPASILTVLLKHREEFSAIYDAGRVLFGSDSSAADKLHAVARIADALAPLVDELAVSVNSSVVHGLAAAGPEAHAEMCGAAGFDWSIVEKLLPVLLQLLSIFA